MLGGVLVQPSECMDADCRTELECMMVSSFCARLWNQGLLWCVFKPLWVLINPLYASCCMSASHLHCIISVTCTKDSGSKLACALNLQLLILNCSDPMTSSDVIKCTVRRNPYRSHDIIPLTTPDLPQGTDVISPSPWHLWGNHSCLPLFAMYLKSTFNIFVKRTWNNNNPSRCGAPHPCGRSCATT